MPLSLLWASRKCPIFNGVMFSDGSAEHVAPDDMPRPRGVRYLVKDGEDFIENFDPTYMTHIFVACEVRYTEMGVVVLAGEGGHGSDGFVAVTDLLNEIRWLAFFDFSNPFVSVRISGDEVVAENNLGEFWFFPLDNPAQVRVETSRRQ